MVTLKLFVGGTRADVTGQYRTWWEQQKRIVLIDRPKIEQAGRGWKVTVLYRQA